MLDIVKWQELFRATNMALSLARSGSLLFRTLRSSNVYCLYSVDVALQKQGQPGSKKPLRLKINSNLMVNSMYTLEHLKVPTDAEVLVPSNSKLVVLFAFMTAKDKQIEKYRSLYYGKGFDVLTVRTPLLNFLYPQIGTQRIANNLVDTLNNRLARSYSSIVVHAFSVGGYQFSEVMKLLYEKAEDEVAAGLPLSEQSCTNLLRSIKGTIFDSICTVDGVAFGIARTFFGNNKIGAIAEKAFHLHNRVFHSISRRHHLAGQSIFEHKPIKCPSLYFASENDILAEFKLVQRLVESSRNAGNDVRFK